MGKPVTGDDERQNVPWEVEMTDTQGPRRDLRVNGRNGRLLYNGADHHD